LKKYLLRELNIVNEKKMYDMKKIFDEYIETEFNVSILGKTFKRKEWIKERKKAHENYRNLFNFENIDNLTKEDFSEFLNFKNNLSWTGLHRQKTKILSDMGKFKETLKYLVNEKIPIEDRINNVVKRNTTFHIEGMGIAIVTAILHIINPEKYGVWNSTSYGALDKIERLPESNSDMGIFYTEFLMVLYELKDDLFTDLTTIDDFLWWLSENIEIFEDIEEEISSELFILSKEDDLRDYLVKNIKIVDPSLTVLNEGKKYNTPDAGEIDILCKDDKGNFIVIETKRHREDDKVVGQTLRYMGWVIKNKAHGDKNIVKGIIIQQVPHDKLNYALIACENVSIKYFNIDVKISGTPFS